ncbi:MAG: aspartate dehydrogenase [Candidatus Micrarchaeota archaeon]
MVLKIGLIGCGAIGTIIGNAVKNGRAGESRITAVFDLAGEKAWELAKKTGAKKVESIGDLVKKCDLVIECASQDAVREYWEAVAGRKDFMVLSVGALLDKSLLGDMLSKAKKGKTKIYVPSGAVCGLDAVKGAGVGRMDTVQLTTTKPPKSLGLEVNERKVIFSGTPEEAVVKFPANINVAAALQLASGKVPVKIEIVADPEAKLNKHEIIAVGEFGGMACRTENLPSTENPKTSALAAMSAVAAIRKITETLVVGT